MGTDPGGLAGGWCAADGVPVRYAVLRRWPTSDRVRPWLVLRPPVLARPGRPFRRRFTVVTVDLAGHGESGTGRRAGPCRLRRGRGRRVTRLDLPEVVLVGHSMGGDVVVEAARRLRPVVRGWSGRTSTAASTSPLGRGNRGGDRGVDGAVPSRLRGGHPGLRPAHRRRRTRTRAWSSGSPTTWPRHHLTSPWTPSGTPSATSRPRSPACASRPTDRGDQPGEAHPPTSNHSPPRHRDNTASGAGHFLMLKIRPDSTCPSTTPSTSS